MIVENGGDYTRNYIAQALLKLMEKKDFREITVTELVHKAGVGRATFYRNFVDKESVLRYWLDRARMEFNAERRFAARTDDEFYEVIVRVLETLKEHCRTFELLIKSRLEYFYLDYLNAGFVENFDNSTKPDFAFLPYAYSGALFNVSMAWVRNHCADPIEAVADSIFYFCFNRRRVAS